MRCADDVKRFSSASGVDSERNIFIFDGLTAEEFTTVLIACKVLEFINFYSASEVSLTRAAFSASEILVTADVWSEFS